MSENEKQQQSENKYGIDRSKITRAKGYKPFPGANGKHRSSEQTTTEKKTGKFKLDLYQKVVIVLTMLSALAYCGVYALNQKGYMLINSSVKYWLWFAVIICLILLIGRFIMKMPKSPMIQKTAKICVAIISIIFIFMTYLSCVDGIEASWRQCAEIKSEDGENSVIVMRIDVDIPENEDEPAEEPAAETEAAPAEESEAAAEDVVGDSYTLYSAFPRINSIFCDSSSQDNLIMLEDGKDVELKMEWIDGDLHLYVEEKALDGMESIVVSFD